MLSSETNIKTPQTRTKRKTHRKAPDITTLHIYTRLYVLSLKLHVFVCLFFFVKEYNFLKHLRSMESDGKRNIKQSFQDSCQILYTHRFDRCNYMHNVYVIMQRVCVCVRM